MNRRGFALLAVLWMVTLLAGVAATAVAAVRVGQRASHNRILLARGRWAAEACLAVAAARWRERALADTGTVELGRTVRCTWRVDDPAARLNVNHADQAVLARLFHALGLRADSADVLAQAIAARRRDRPFTAVGQLTPLLGFDARVAPFLTADGPGAVNASAAPADVLAALPGMTPEAVGRLVTRRAWRRPVRSLDELMGELSPAARDAILAQYAALVRVLAFDRRQLVLSVEGWVAAHGPYPRARIEVLVAALPDRLAVLRRRMG